MLLFHRARTPEDSAFWSGSRETALPSTVHRQELVAPTISPSPAHLNLSLSIAAAPTRPLHVFRRYTTGDFQTLYGALAVRIY